jgi:DnaK suppressor protein
MQKKQMDDFKKKLEKKRKEILATINSARSAGEESMVEEVKDVADKASSSYSRELFYGLSDVERRILQLVEEALARIETRMFGQCVHCGEKIQPRRLDAVPWARHCINCQEMQEKGFIK